MRYIRHLFLLCSLLLYASGAVAQEYAIISNKKVPPLTLEQIRAVYLKKLTRIDRISLVPINLNVHDPLRQSFERHILHMGFQRLKSYWSRQHYLGYRPPLTMKSQESVLALVKNIDGALAYVHTRYLDDDVQILYRWRE